MLENERRRIVHSRWLPHFVGGICRFCVWMMPGAARAGIRRTLIECWPICWCAAVAAFWWVRRRARRRTALVGIGSEMATSIGCLVLRTRRRRQFCQHVPVIIFQLTGRRAPPSPARSRPDTKGRGELQKKVAFPRSARRASELSSLGATRTTNIYQESTSPPRTNQRGPIIMRA